MKLALITGASRGLGLALFTQLQAQGFKVIDFSRHAPYADSVRLDLSQPQSVQAIVAAALKTLPPVTELWVINNAGAVDPIGPVGRKASSEIISNAQINFTGALAFLAEVLAQFQAAPGRKVIANISSGAAVRPFAGWSLYCAAKAGVEHFIRSVAVEQAQEAQPFIPINISPGVIDTAMQASIRAASSADFPDLARFEQLKAQGQLATPEQIATAVIRIMSLPDLQMGERYEAAKYRD
jgi:benzil reductase ((S)-benzoin forming)